MAVITATSLENNALAKVLTITSETTLELALKKFLIENGIASSSFDYVITGLTTDLDKVTNHPLITLSKGILKLSVKALSQALVEELTNSTNPCPSTQP